MTPRRQELDFYRAAAMLAVMLIHITSNFVLAETRFSAFGINPAFLLNQVCRFAVPGFLLLSGTGLSLSRREESYGAFVKRRMAKTLPAYLVWCAVYFLEKGDYSAGTLLVGLVTGNLAAHLYFIIILLQLYLLFPLLHRLAERRGAALTAVSLAVSLALQSALYCLTTFGEPLTLPTGTKNCFLFWIFYFVAGMAIAQWPEKLDAALESAKRRRGVWALAFALLAVLLTAEGRATGSYGSNMRPLIFPYVIASFFCLAGTADALLRRRSVSRAVSFLSRHSMSIYYVHVLILDFTRRFALFTTGMRGLYLTAVTVAALSIAAAAAIDRLRGRQRRG
ncbi:MAG: acyltransferase [Oscillospiraceae bacterium]|nr:acyltransferase [Oscillospiraceae bacterium]